MAGRRFMSRSQFRIRYAGLRGSMRLWRDFFDDMREARDLRRRRKEPRRFTRPPAFLPGQIVPVDASALMRGLGAQQAAQLAQNPYAGMLNQSAFGQYGLSGQVNPYGVGGIMDGLLGAHYAKRWPF